MELKFFSIEEVKEFVTQLKGTRGGKNAKNEDEGNETGTAATGGAPAPILPPAGGAAFSPGPSGGAAAGAAGFPGQGSGSAFPAAGASVSPEVDALVKRIVVKIDGAVAGGQPVEAVAAWFRTQAGPEAANATLEQIKTVFLPKMPMAALQNVAQLMAA